MKLITGGIVVIFGLYLISLLFISLWNKSVAIRYFGSFASSAKAHYLEQLLRLIVGVSFIIFSKFMLFSKMFNFFGWIIVLTTIVLLLTPWKWHHNFGKWAIPFTIRNLVFYTISASLFGVFILICVLKPAFLNFYFFFGRKILC